VAWAPDLDPTTPGILTDISNMLPTARGYAPDFSVAAGVTYTQTLPTQCRGAALVQQSGNFLPILLLGTATTISAAISGTLLPLTRTTPYVTVTDTQDDGWRFGAFGVDALAVSYANQLQTTPLPEAGTRFANVSGAPAAGTMCVQSGFVMLANINDGAFPYADGYWTCALQNVTSWAPDVATFASRDRLMQTPGGVVRLVAFQDDIIAFKATSILRGTFTGDPSVPWAWRVVSAQIGIVSHDAVCEAEGILYFLSADGFYAFSGAQLQRIESAPWEWFKSRASFGGKIRAMAQWDSIRRVVRWYYEDFYQTAVAGVYQGGVAYAPVFDRWGRFASNATAIAYVSDSVPTLTSEARPRQNVPLVMDATTFGCRVYRGPVQQSQFTSNFIGNDQQVTVLTGARVRLTGTAVAAICIPRSRATLDDGLSPWVIGTAAARTADGRYDFHVSARWHSLEFRQDAGGMYEVLGYQVEMPRAGQR
jgi:hypothetical protein